MDLDNLFVSDLLDTLLGETPADDRVTTQALGEEGDQPDPGAPEVIDCGEPEPPQDAVIEPEPVSTTQDLGEEGDQPEDTWDTEPEPVVTTDAVGEDGDQPEPDGSDAPAEQGIWAGEDGNSPGCVVEESDPEPEPEPAVEEVDTWWPCDEAAPETPTECEPADESDDEPAETIDPALQCW